MLTLINNIMNKEQILLILNVYQNYYNDFVNISEKDLDEIYKTANQINHS